MSETTYVPAPITSTGDTAFFGDVVHAPWAEVVARLGLPHASHPPGDKVQHEWAFRGPDGRVATLYDWKERGVPFPTEWHVGGTDAGATRAFAAWWEAGGRIRP